MLTLKKAGFDVPLGYCVKDQVDVNALLKYTEEIRQAQGQFWHRNFTEELRHQIRQNALTQFGWVL